MANIEQLIREDLHDFTPYSSARMEASQGRIWLNANESPCQLIDADPTLTLNRYPQKQPDALLSSLANYYNVTPKNLLVTRGSDEGIDLLIRCFCRPQLDSIIICPPTFGMYAVAAKLQAARLINVPLIGDNYALDVDGIIAQRDNNVKLIFLCSPNNPTGTSIALDDVQRLCQAYADSALIIIDEAYVEFSSQGSYVRLLSQYDNLVILRTLSKAFALAGLRVGCALANAAIITWLNRLLAPYPLPTPSLQLAQQALMPDAIVRMRQHVANCIEQRGWLVSELNALSIVKHITPSEANFLLISFTHDVESACRAQGIILRDMGTRIKHPHTLRISIGTHEENQILINQLKQL